MDESNPRPIDLDEDIVGLYKPYSVLDVPRPIRPEDKYICALVNRSRNLLRTWNEPLWYVSIWKGT